VFRKQNGLEDVVNLYLSDRLEVKREHSPTPLKPEEPIVLGLAMVLGMTTLSGSKTSTRAILERKSAKRMPMSKASS